MSECAYCGAELGSEPAMCFSAKCQARRIGTEQQEGQASDLRKAINRIILAVELGAKKEGTTLLLEELKDNYAGEKANE